MASGDPPEMALASLVEETCGFTTDLQSVVACAAADVVQVQLVPPRLLQHLFEAQQQLPVSVNVVDLEVEKRAEETFLMSHFNEKLSFVPDHVEKDGQQVGDTESVENIHEFEFLSKAFEEAFCHRLYVLCKKEPHDDEKCVGEGRLLTRLHAQAKRLVT